MVAVATQFIGTNDRTRHLAVMMNELFEEAAHREWSDLHFENRLDGSMRIRARVRGRLRDVRALKDHEGRAVVNMMRYRANLDVTDARHGQDGRFVQVVDGRRVEIRLDILPTVSGESAVCRLLDSKKAGLPLENLRMSPEVLAAFRWALRQREGMILNSGPTGSGKTTTLYAGIGSIATPDRKFMTAEDPVEYVIDGLIQVPVGQGTGLTFASAIRYMMRQDPDDILVGEIRDEETAQMAVRAALTGHKVFSSIHAYSANGTYSRLTDLGLPRHLISASMRLVIAQRLLMTVCSHCKVEKPVAYPEAFAGSSVSQPEKEWVGEGCSHCEDTPGYSGRQAIFEVIVYDQAYRRALGNEEEMLRVARGQKQFSSLRDAAAKVCLEGKTNSHAMLEALADVEE